MLAKNWQTASRFLDKVGVIHQSKVSFTILDKNPGQNRAVREILRNLIGCLEDCKLEKTGVYTFQIKYILRNGMMSRQGGKQRTHSYVILKIYLLKHKSRDYL